MKKKKEKMMIDNNYCLDNDYGENNKDVHNVRLVKYILYTRLKG